MRHQEDLYLVTFKYCIHTGFLFLVWFGLLLYVSVNSYGHDAMLSSLNHTFSRACLNKRLNKYFMHIHSLEFNDHSPQKYGTRLKSNSPPLVLQSDMHKWSDTLPTALREPEQVVCVYIIHACLMGKIAWFAS